MISSDGKQDLSSARKSVGFRKLIQFELQSCKHHDQAEWLGSKKTSNSMYSTNLMPTIWPPVQSKRPDLKSDISLKTVKFTQPWFKPSTIFFTCLKFNMHWDLRAVDHGEDHEKTELRRNTLKWNVKKIESDQFQPTKKLNWNVQTVTHITLITTFYHHHPCAETAWPLSKMQNAHIKDVPRSWLPLRLIGRAQCTPETRQRAAHKK